MNQKVAFLTFFLKIMCLFTGQLLMGQVTMIIRELPNKPNPDGIYISGDFEGWSGGKQTYKLKEHNGIYSITLDNTQDKIAYKFTKGSWDSVELNADGSSKDNRAYSFSKKNDTIHVSIEKWSDQTGPISTASGNVRILTESFFMPELNKNRRIWIYLPSTYIHSSKKYPVIYMQDGQNLFDDQVAYSGEWGIDETLNQLSKERKLDFIVIGIDNGGTDRMSEYSPWDLAKYDVNAQGEAYVKFIINTLKPYVDKRYRTLSNKTNTVIAGSSLGGLISHYAALKHPEIFGKSVVFSPSFQLFPECFDFAENNAGIQNSKMYLMAGDQESKNMVDKMNQMIKTMENAGFPETNIKSKVVIGGAHNESLWKDQFEEAITWLFLSALNSH